MVYVNNMEGSQRDDKISGGWDNDTFLTNVQVSFESQLNATITFNRTDSAMLSLLSSPLIML